MTYTLNTIINFGKYKNKSIQYLIENDIDYFKWCCKNVKDFILDNDVKNYFNKTKETENQQKYTSLLKRNPPKYSNTIGLVVDMGGSFSGLDEFGNM